MRSLLFVPADAAKKLDKAMTSGADALIVDLEDSIPTPGKADARLSAAAFIRDAVTATHRPRLLVRINGFATGLADADLDTVAPARPDAIMLPKAEGGADVVRADAKLSAREAIAGLPDGCIKIVAIATETATALFLAGTYCGASERLEALTWGAEDLSAAAPRDGGSPPRRLHRQNGDSSGAGADYQRGVHSVSRGGCTGARRRRCVRGQSEQGNGRYRRGDVRPTAPGARPASAGASASREDCLRPSIRRVGGCRPTSFSRTPHLDRTFARRREIPASPPPTCRAAPHDRNMSGVRYDRRRGPPARP